MDEEMRTEEMSWDASYEETVRERFALVTERIGRIAGMDEAGERIPLTICDYDRDTVLPVILRAARSFCCFWHRYTGSPWREGLRAEVWRNVRRRMHGSMRRFCPECMRKVT